MRFFVVVFVVVAAGCAPQAPTAACRQFVACQAAYDDAAGVDAVDVSAYERDGSCWQSPQFAEVCDGECVEALESLRAAADAAGFELDDCAADEGGVDDDG